MNDLKDSGIKFIPNKGIKRYSGIDSFKGFSIWTMMWLHCILYQGFENKDEVIQNLLESMPIWVYPLFLPIFILFLWGTIFTFANNSTISIQTLNVINSDPKKIRSYIMNRLLVGMLIIILNRVLYTLVTTPFFDNWSINFPQIQIQFEALPLDLIAWGGFLVPSLIALVYGLFKIKNPYYLISVFLFFIITWVALTPVITSLGEKFIPWLENKDLFFLKYIVCKFVRGRFRLFPNMAFGMLGAVFGFMLHYKFDLQRVLNVTLVIFFLSTIGLLLWVIIVDFDVFALLSIDYIPIPFQIMNLGFIPFVFVAFVKDQEFADEEITRIRAVNRTKWWRRYSLVSLTVFTFDVLIANFVLNFFTNLWGSVVAYPEFVIRWTFWQFLLFILMTFAFWEIILRTWEKIDYKLSVDWFLVKTHKLLTGKEMAKIDVTKLLYEPAEWRMCI